jgi:peptidoglycan/LPS O-acetylase OafA/YrhL
MASQNTWPALLCIILIVRLAATSAFRFMDNVPYQSSRLKTIDGLRGFLALAVFFDHSFVYFGYVRSDKWDAPVGNVFSALGEAGVALFFMITGYLFWAHMLRERGKPDWLKLFVGRLFRIGPLYLVAIAVMFLLVLRDTGFRLNVAPTQLSGELFYWLGLGFFAPGPINGTEHPGLQLAGVTWSLRFEWLFYLSLPISAVAARRSRLQLVLVLSICVGLLLYVGATQRSASVASAACCALLFSFGMVCAGAAQLKLLQAT